MKAVTDYTVLLGLGATKAGTSWLYQRLAAHPETYFRTIKEHHYFNCARMGAWDRQIANHRGQHKSMFERAARKLGFPAANMAPDAFAQSDIMQRLSDRYDWLKILERKAYDPEAYMSYLTAKAGDAKLVGDITPAYALLDEEWLQKALSIAPDVRMIYSVRDPLERLWSHVRMMAERRDPKGVATPDRAHRILMQTIQGRETELVTRADYAGILPRLTSCIPNDRLLILTFDELVKGDGFARVCDFLGLSAFEPDPDPVFPAQKVELREDARALALEWLRPQYDAALAHFGALPDRWNTP